VRRQGRSPLEVGSATDPIVSSNYRRLLQAAIPAAAVPLSNHAYSGGGARAAALLDGQYRGCGQARYSPQEWFSIARIHQRADDTFVSEHPHDCIVKRATV
jgi:hypothetical protein